MSVEIYNLETAREHVRQGRLQEWVDASLRTAERPNNGLADAVIQRDGYWVGPAEVRLEDLKPCCGPQREADAERAAGISRYLVHPEPDTVWDASVENLIARGISPDTTTPILVRYVYQVLGVTDGNHRVAAFRAQGFRTCWALIELGTENR